MTDLTRVLGTLAGLQHESMGALQELAQLFDERRYEGADLCRQGAPADTFWILTSGSVSVVRTTSGNTPVEVAVLEPCALVGIAGLIGIETRAATLRARGPVHVLEMSSAAAPQRSVACARVRREAHRISWRAAHGAGGGRAASPSRRAGTRQG